MILDHQNRRYMEKLDLMAKNAQAVTHRKSGENLIEGSSNEFLNIFNLRNRCTKM